MSKKLQNRTRRHTRIRSTISGTAERPRLAVFRSNTSIYAQLIDDVAGKTLAASSDLAIQSGTKSEKAAIVGKTLAELALKVSISTVVFDRGGFLYAGRVKALADAARTAGLVF